MPFPLSPQVGIVASKERAGETVVRINESFFRPIEDGLLVGDPSKVNGFLSPAIECSNTVAGCSSSCMLHLLVITGVPRTEIGIFIMSCTCRPAPCWDGGPKSSPLSRNWLGT